MSRRGMLDAVVAGGPGTAPTLLRDLFARVVAAHPHRQAVTDAAGRRLTYAELDARSNQLARWLIGHGVGPETLVALALERSVTLLTAIWAVGQAKARSERICLLLMAM